MDKINYFLVLERRLGDYILIDINKLDICTQYVDNDIAMIDSFTCRFTEDEIKGAIERSNMAQASYLAGSLKVISDFKHNFNVLTKDKFSEIVEFQNSIEEISLDFRNKLYGSYKKVVERTFEDKGFIQGILERFKIALRSGNKAEIFSIVEELPYAKSRVIYFTIYDEIQKRKQERLRKLEKLNDAA